MVPTAQRNKTTNDNTQGFVGVTPKRKPASQRVVSDVAKLTERRLPRCGGRQACGEMELDLPIEVLAQLGAQVRIDRAASKHRSEPEADRTQQAHRAFSLRQTDDLRDGRRVVERADRIFLEIDDLQAARLD